MKALRTTGWCARIKCKKGDFFFLCGISSDRKFSEEETMKNIKTLTGKYPKKNEYKIVKVEIREIK